MSGLSNYVRGTFDIGEELLHSLEKGEIEDLRSLLGGKSRLEWERWRIQNHDLILSFVSATPAQRKSLKKYQEHRLLLPLAGFCLCREASTLLKVVTSPVLTAGISYRHMAALAGDAYSRLFDDDVPLWPYENVPSPFGTSADDTAVR